MMRLLLQLLSLTASVPTARAGVYPAPMAPAAGLCQVSSIPGALNVSWHLPATKPGDPAVDLWELQVGIHSHNTTTNTTTTKNGDTAAVFLPSLVHTTSEPHALLLHQLPNTTHTLRLRAHWSWPAARSPSTSGWSEPSVAWECRTSPTPALPAVAPRNIGRAGVLATHSIALSWEQPVAELQPGHRYNFSVFCAEGVHPESEGGWAHAPPAFPTPGGGAPWILCARTEWEFPTGGGGAEAAAKFRISALATGLQPLRFWWVRVVLHTYNAVSPPAGMRTRGADSIFKEIYRVNEDAMQVDFLGEHDAADLNGSVFLSSHFKPFDITNRKPKHIPPGLRPITRYCVEVYSPGAVETSKTFAHYVSCSFMHLGEDAKCKCGEDGSLHRNPKAMCQPAEVARSARLVGRDPIVETYSGYRPTTPPSAYWYSFPGRRPNASSPTPQCLQGGLGVGPAATRSNCSWRPRSTAALIWPAALESAGWKRKHRVHFYANRAAFVAAFAANALAALQPPCG